MTIRSSKLEVDCTRRLMHAANQSTQSLVGTEPGALLELRIFTNAKGEQTDMMVTKQRCDSSLQVLNNQHVSIVSLSGRWLETGLRTVTQGKPTA